MEIYCILPMIFGTIVTVGIVISLVISAHVTLKEKKFLATHIIKCKQCGSTDTSYIKMESYSTYHGTRGSSTTYRRGKDKFYCNKCKKNHFIENGIWIEK